MFRLNQMGNCWFSDNDKFYFIVCQQIFHIKNVHFHNWALAIVQFSPLPYNEDCAKFAGLIVQVKANFFFTRDQLANENKNHYWGNGTTDWVQRNDCFDRVYYETFLHFNQTHFQFWFKSKHKHLWRIFALEPGLRRNR